MTPSSLILSGFMLISKQEKKYFFNDSLTEKKSSVICPRHSVCVPWACGLKNILLKFVEDFPEATLPTKSSILTGSIRGWSIYHAIGLSLFPLNGIEISIGSDNLSRIVFIFLLLFDKFSQNNDRLSFDFSFDLFGIIRHQTNVSYRSTDFCIQARTFYIKIFD